MRTLLLLTVLLAGCDADAPSPGTDVYTNRFCIGGWTVVGFNGSTLYALDEAGNYIRCGEK